MAENKLADARRQAEEAVRDARTCLTGWGAEARLECEKRLASELGRLQAKTSALLAALPGDAPREWARADTKARRDALRWLAARGGARG